MNAETRTPLDTTSSGVFSFYITSHKHQHEARAVGVSPRMTVDQSEFHLHSGTPGDKMSVWTDRFSCEVPSTLSISSFATVAWIL
jgi:hypothetical protein